MLFLQIIISIMISFITGQFVWAAESKSVHGAVVNQRDYQHSVPIQSRPNHPQGEIWYLRDSRAHTEAENLEKIIENVLKTEPIYAPYLIENRGISTSYYVQFSNNIFAIMKEADPFEQKGPAYEVAAYRIDRALNMNMVPVTVMREYQGKKVSLQLIVPAADKQNYDQIQSDWQIQQENNVLIFDSILLNADRMVQVMHNIILTPEGRLVAIDHSRLMRNMNQTVWREPNELTPEFVNGLIHFDEFRIRQLLGDLLDWEDMTKIMMRMKVTKDMMMRSLQGRTISTTIASVNASKKYPHFEYEVPNQLQSIFKSNLLVRISCQQVFRLN